MPVIEIKGCTDCLHHDINNYAIDGMMQSQDQFAISCRHPDQECDDYIGVSIKNHSGSMYFKCPLENDRD